MFAFLAAAAAGASLWQGVQAGMSYEQLKAVRPHARPIPEELKRTYTINCTHIDDNVMLYGRSYKLCYTLRDKGVVDVTLYGDFEHTTSVLDSLKPDLAGKYGQPVLDKCESNRFGVNCNAVFRKDGVRIRVADLYFSLTDTHTFSIHYEPIAGDSLPL